MKQYNLLRYHRDKETQLFLSLLATEPDNEQLVELCDLWEISPAFWGNTVILNRIATITRLAKYLIESEEQS